MEHKKSRTKTPEHVSHWCHKGFCTSRWGSGWGSNTDQNFEVAQWRWLRISSADQGMYGALRSARDLKRWCLSLYCKVTWMSTERRTSFLNPLWFIRVILEANPAKTINSPACSRASWHQSVRSRTHPPSEVVEHLPRCENDRDSLGAPENGGILQENPRFAL